MKMYILTLLTVATLSVSGKAMASTFSDVSVNNWAAPTINAMVEKGVIKGYADGSFKPQNPVTKAEFARMYHSLFPEVNTVTGEATVPYEDTKGHWAEADFKALFSDTFYEGVFMDHYTRNGQDFKFYLNPNKQLTRWDMALYTSALTKSVKPTRDFVTLDVFKAELSKYKDIKIKNVSEPVDSEMGDPSVHLYMNYYQDDIETFKADLIYTAIHNGVMAGSNGFFRPSDKVTRAEAATILERLYKQINQ